MKSLLLLISLIALLFIGWSDLLACGDEWETRPDEMQAQFDQSIAAECALKHVTCRELDKGK